MIITCQNIPSFGNSISWAIFFHCGPFYLSLSLSQPLHYHMSSQCVLLYLSEALSQLSSLPWCKGIILDWPNRKYLHEHNYHKRTYCWICSTVTIPEITFNVSVMNPGFLIIIILFPDRYIQYIIHTSLHASIKIPKQTLWKITVWQYSCRTSCKCWGNVVS